MLPCPFCGSPAEHYPDGDMEGYIIMCGNKNGDCNLQAFGFTTPEEAEKAWNTRAALLQGGQPVSNHDELPYAQVKAVADLYALCWQSGEVVTYTPDPEKATIWLNNYSGTCVQEYVKLERLQEALAGNSPVVPDGYALVPIVPTEDMVINGFESEPDPHFSDEKVWAEYEALSGCRRAARRAELCWAAMIKAAPKPEGNNG
ncbi:hypothetical protein GWF22_09695 [Salmonella enterica]|nr:hypothetical protein [Salmonella enterica subsp. enterica serovar Bredeney]EEG1033242.1 hypothetical protein [Salmonella enterica]EEO0128049.1 hypothetical protein [Salmonella enterica subsp. enterica serovar Abony]